MDDPRNAAHSALAMLGGAGDASEQYMGHAPKGITARHYIPRLKPVTKGEVEASHRPCRSCERMFSIM